MVRVWNGEAPLLRGLLFPALWVLAALYGAALKIREGLYRNGLMRTEQPAIPVISVGNISLGGTGKTTVVAMLSEELKRRGYKPAIIMRGYKKKRGGTFAVDPERDSAREAGDEATMLARRTKLPVVVGKRRGDGIKKAVEEFGIDIAVFDDGYQVRDVEKKVEVLVLNSQERPESMHLFPLGFLREPLTMAKRADIVLISKGDPGDRMRGLAPGTPAFRVRYRPLHLYNLKRGAMTDYRYVSGKKVLAFSGLGDNGSFFALLKDIGADVVRTVEFPDHYQYEESDLRRMEAYADVDLLVTTEKDAIKMDRMDVSDSLFYLSIEAQIEDEERFIDLALSKARA
jgi:tetraacyldisaccharide 4'-kinase